MVRSVRQALHHRYGHGQAGLTGTDLRVLRYLANQAGGLGARNGRVGLTLPRARKLAREGYVTIKGFSVTAHAGRPFGEPGPGRLHHAFDWAVTITDRGRTAAEQK